jgi:hypothetical protein
MMMEEIGSRQIHSMARPGKLIYEHFLEGVAETHLIALACAEPSEGHERWTLRLLQERMTQLSYGEQVSHETIRTMLQ